MMEFLRPEIDIAVGQFNCPVYIMNSRVCIILFY